MWLFSPRPARPASARVRPRNVRPTLDALEDRALMSHTVNIPVPINAQVLAFAKAHVNRQVGDGQCATLAADAVKAAGGVSFARLGPTGPNADYVWGTPVKTLTPTAGSTAGIAPGDILQFSGVREVDTMTIRYADGRTSTTTWTSSPAHHTAIVNVVGGNAPNDLQVFESNIQGEPPSMRYLDQTGSFWGGSGSRTTSYNGYSITVTHAMTGGVIHVYQPYRIVPVSVPGPPVPIVHF